MGGQWGYYTDTETGLLLLTHRYYDPAEGRFLTRDPIGYSGGVNLYAYVTNNPTNAVDPLGFCDDKPWWEKLGEGHYYGTTGGQRATEWYAEKWDETGNPLWAVPGLFSSLWTPGTWKAAAVTVATAPIGFISRAASPTVIGEVAGARTLAEELAAKELVTAGKGIPIAGRGVARVLNQAERLAAQYGGRPQDWIKMVSRGVREIPGGARITAHWYENKVIKLIVEIKMK